MEIAHKLRAIVVLFHPDEGAINMVREIARQGYAPVVVSNSTNKAELDSLHEAGIDVMVNPENVGLAAAFNQGIERALASGAEYVMLLDQDTRPPADMGTRLLVLAARIEASGRPLGCIGPVPVDRKRPRARTLARQLGETSIDPGLSEVDTIISSGMVIPRAALDAVGCMWSELFIDHVDHEWCFRARAAGRGIFAATSVQMPHDMGDSGVEIFGRYKPVHRSAVRHFYIVRNTLWLARCSFIPARWRVMETIKLAVRVPSYLWFSSKRGETMRALTRAIRAGLRSTPTRTLWSTSPRHRKLGNPGTL